MPTTNNHTRLINNIEYALYAYIAWRLCGYFIGTASLAQLVSSSSIIIAIISGATFAGKKIFKKCEGKLSGSPPFAATAIILILTITIILNLKDNSLFSFSLLLAIYCRLVKGIAASRYNATISKFSILNLISIIAGFAVASCLAPLHDSNQLAANAWRLPFICATTLSLFDIIKNNIAMPTVRQAKHIYKSKNQEQSRAKQVGKSPWVEAILLCSFLLLELEVGGYFWLKSIVTAHSASEISAFLISITIFLLGFGLFGGHKIPTNNLLGWGFIGPVITTPLHFMIGHNPNFILDLSGQAFFMIFVAAAAAGIIQRLQELFPHRKKIQHISLCWAVSFIATIFLTNAAQQRLNIDPLWIVAATGCLLWLASQSKSVLKY